jgi:peptidylprolyl isomerase
MRFAIMKFSIVFSLLAFLATPALAADAPKSLDEILAASPASDWQALDPQNTLYMDLPAGRVVIELAPAFAPQTAANIRALAHAHYFDGAFIVRAQDNYVVQWARDEKSPAVKVSVTGRGEFERARNVAFTPLPGPDSYAVETGFASGFPAARDAQHAWLVHCYGMVGAGRDNGADSGTGSELYAVIGQAPRHLDRNITLVGRVVQGMELLSVMPRGTGPLGFYIKPEQRTKIASVRLAADVPPAQRLNLEALRTDSTTFRTIVEARRNRREPWFFRPAGHIDVCNVPLPVREKR